MSFLVFLFYGFLFWFFWHTLVWGRMGEDGGGEGVGLRHTVID